MAVHLALRLFRVQLLFDSCFGSPASSLSRGCGVLGSELGVALLRRSSASWRLVELLGLLGSASTASSFLDILGSFSGPHLREIPSS